MKATITVISGEEDNLRMASEAASMCGYDGLYGVGEYTVEAEKEDVETLCTAMYESGIDCTAMMYEGIEDEQVFIPEHGEWAACR